MNDSPAQTYPPYRSPSYPRRVHIRERAKLQAVLTDCEVRIADALLELNAIQPGPVRDAHERFFSQMLGTRDQIAAAAQRMPTEVGDLYEEDSHRLEEAVAALDRIFSHWKPKG
ncbi:MAG: hypothetical protein ABI353_09575 [Isosphaeraceae bacterium]